MICPKCRHIFLQVVGMAALTAVILLLSSCGSPEDTASVEFLGYIDQAEELYGKVTEEYNALEGNTYGHLERVRLMDAFLADLTGVQERQVLLNVWTPNCKARDKNISICCMLPGMLYPR